MILNLPDDLNFLLLPKFLEFTISWVPFALCETFQEFDPCYFQNESDRKHN